MRAHKCLSADWMISTDYFTSTINQRTPSQLPFGSIDDIDPRVFRRSYLAQWMSQLPFGLIDDIDEDGWVLASVFPGVSQMPFGLIDDIDCTTFLAYIQAYFSRRVASVSRRGGVGEIWRNSDWRQAPLTLRRGEFTVPSSRFSVMEIENNQDNSKQLLGRGIRSKALGGGCFYQLF